MEVSSKDELYMQRALELATFGRSDVSPNPLVGCVIVKEGKIIGEGWHQKYGGPHAEVNAVRSVKEAAQLEGATAYVSLEPCSHHGKTPPCADLLVKKKIARVVIANLDPNPLVSGQGIEKLKKAGVEVIVGTLQEKGAWLNRRFFTSITQSRPYVILKWAETADGFIARSNGDSKWISCAESRTLVHKWRTEEDAILVGKNTASKDDPELTARLWKGKNPTRVVLDNQLELSSTLKLFDRSNPTIIFNQLKAEKQQNLEWVKVAKSTDPEKILQELHQRKLLSVIVEGGTKVLQNFIDRGCWDEARIFRADSAAFGSGIHAPQLKNAIFVEERKINIDQLIIYKKKT